MMRSTDGRVGGTMKLSHREFKTTCVLLVPSNTIEVLKTKLLKPVRGSVDIKIIYRVY